ncbi:tetratricopeptide repeat protein [Marinospirillum minutulum]|uniref:tetratricopeptide repeat protein n=1 Tax=Marinospirillum minutulum TaxID=64974 RepID=UPI000418006F|nr:tetratricopeptide repeat protein [Marinospirillum minutulum]
MQRFAIALLFILVSGCAAQAPWEKVDLDQQAEAYTNLGMGYLNQGQINRGLINFKKALKARPSYSEALHGTALALQQQGEFDLSERYFKKALQTKGNETDVRNNYAAFLFKQSRYDEARKQLEIASKDIYYADRRLVFTNLGYVSIKLEQTDKALGYFQQALVLDSTFIPPHRALLELFSKQQAWQQAEQHWLALRDAQINDETTLKQALIVVQHTGNQKEARYINSLLNSTN